MLASSAAPLFLDNLTNEISTLKHNTLFLHNENKEIKQILADIRGYHQGHTNEVKFLKGTISQLMEQQDLFKNSFQILEKQVKQLVRENCQIKSKYDILQLRMKNFQVNQDPLITARSITQSPTYESHVRQTTKEEALDFQLSPRLDNIVHKGTRDRLENLMKDLEGVWKKGGEIQKGKTEDQKEEKDGMNEDWLSPSELNTSQTQSERSQLTFVTHQVGEVPFENMGLLGGQPYFLIDQLDMLNPSQSSPKNFGDDRSIGSTIFSKAVSFGEASPKDKPPQGVVPPKAKTYRSQYTEKINESPGRLKSNERTLSIGSNLVPKKEIEIEKGTDYIVNGNRIPPIKIENGNQPFYISPRMHAQEAQNMTAPSTITQIGSEVFSCLGTEENWAQKYDTPKQLYSQLANGNMDKGNAFGYLKEENMLMEVLDKRGDHIPLQKGGVHQNHHNGIALTPDSRAQDKVYYFPQRTEDGGDKEILERINTIDTSILSTNSETSSVSNSLRGGHKRLKLIRKNMKSKGGEGVGGSQDGSISSNFA